MLKIFSFAKIVLINECLRSADKVVYPEAPVHSHRQYYIANGAGAAVSRGSSITLDRSMDTEEQVPWTLETYLHLSNLKYPSKASMEVIEGKFTCTNNIAKHQTLSLAHWVFAYLHLPLIMNSVSLLAAMVLFMHNQ